MPLSSNGLCCALQCVLPVTFCAPFSLKTVVVARATAFYTYRLTRFCLLRFVPLSMLPFVRPIQLLSFLQGHCDYKFYARCTSTNSSHNHVSAYTYSHIIFLARVLPRQFSVYLSCDCKLLLPYISYNFLCIGLLLFVLSTLGVLC